jgi:hypothetical protein
MRILNIWKRVAIAIALVTMLASGAIWEVRRARALNPQPDPPGRYTMIGIVRGKAYASMPRTSRPPIRIRHPIPAACVWGL